MNKDELNEATAGAKAIIEAMPHVVAVMDGVHHGSFIVAEMGTAKDGRTGISLSMWDIAGPMKADKDEIVTIPIWAEMILPLADMLIGANERVAAARIEAAMGEKPAVQN